MNELYEPFDKTFVNRFIDRVILKQLCLYGWLLKDTTQARSGIRSDVHTQPHSTNLRPCETTEHLAITECNRRRTVQ